MIPVSAYIPGCPASPSAIIDGVVKLLMSLEASEEAPPVGSVGSGAGELAVAGVAQGPSADAEQ